MNMEWSFIICTDGTNNLQFHETIIETIVNQNIPKFEIIFVCENLNFKPLAHPNIITVYTPFIKDKHITFKKNVGIRCAKYENLCILHDYLALDIDWYQSMIKFDKDWNVCSFRIMNLDNTRFSDWVIFNHPIHGHTLVDYNTPTTEYHYVPGLAYCVKKYLALKYPLNEELVWGEAEDIEWSDRIKVEWNYHLNINALIYSLKQK